MIHNKRKLYNDIMNNVSKVVKKRLNENMRKNVAKVTMLDKPVKVSNIQMNEPIFYNPSLSLWYRDFVLHGGAAFVEKVQGMDSHTFVCNTEESRKMLERWLVRNNYENGLDQLGLF